MSHTVGLFGIKSHLACLPDAVSGVLEDQARLTHPVGGASRRDCYQGCGRACEVGAGGRFLEAAFLSAVNPVQWYLK